MNANNNKGNMRPWNTPGIERPYSNKPKWGNKPGGENYDFYNSTQWRNFRAFYWQHHPRECVVCGKYANILDHIIPIDQGGAKLDENNVQGMCYRHHQGKHNKQRHGK